MNRSLSPERTIDAIEKDFALLNSTKKILYIDMDGVVANFDKAIKDICPELETSDRFENYEARSIEVDRVVSQNTDIFQNLEPIEGAIEAVNKLFELYEVYFLSTPMWDIPESFMGKRIWLGKNFGEKANRRLILTHRKDLAIGDYLVDDRLKNGAGQFKGEHIHFGTDRFPDWRTTLEYLNDKIKN